MRPATARSAGRPRLGAAAGPGGQFGQAGRFGQAGHVGQAGQVVPLPRADSADGPAPGVGGDAGEPPADRAEIRVLGPLRVRRADGSVVSDRDWRTGKNADLLRWLALQAGNPVSTEVLIDGLWPGRRGVARAGQPAHRGLAAAAGAGRRHPGARARRGAAAARLGGRDDVRRPRRGRGAPPPRGPGRARPSPSPARRTPCTSPTSRSATAPPRRSASTPPPWPRCTGGCWGTPPRWRSSWDGCATPSSSPAGCWRSTRVSEQASRALMLGLAGLGETHHALREYERCRRALADELGVDPSPQTRAVHLQVLRPAPARTGGARRSSGAPAELELADAGAASRPRPPGAARSRPVVVLAGAEGSGRRRAGRAGLPARRPPAGRGSGRRRAADVGGAAGLGAAVGARRDGRPRPAGPHAPRRSALDGATATPAAASRLVTSSRAPSSCCVRRPAPTPRWDAGAPAGPGTLVLEPLLREDVEELAAAAPAGRSPPRWWRSWSRSPPACRAASSPRCAVVRRRSAGGHDHRGGAGSRRRGGHRRRSGRRALARALPRLEGDALEALLLCRRPGHPRDAVAAGPAAAAGAPGEESAAARRAGDVGPGAARRPGAAAHLRGRRGVAPPAAAGRRPRLDAPERRAAAAPAGRRGAADPGAARVGHWLQAGERELAGVAALEAAAEARPGRHAGARTRCCRSRWVSCRGRHRDRVCLLERLGDACAVLRRPEEAARRTSGRWASRWPTCSGGDAAAAQARGGQRTAGARADPAQPRRATTRPRCPGWACRSPAPGRARARGALRETLEQADRAAKRPAGVRARLQLAAAVCLPRRAVPRRARVGRGGGAAEHRGRRSGCGRRSSAQPAVLLGGARTALQPLAEAARAAEAPARSGWEAAARDAACWPRTTSATRVRGAVAALMERVTTGKVDESVPELATIGLRVLVEREEFDLAEAMSSHLPLAARAEHPGRPAPRPYRQRRPRRGLRRATDTPRHAAAVVDDRAAPRGCTLLVPEAAARLVVVTAPLDVARRGRRSRLRRRRGRGAGGPREEFWRRMARAAMPRPPGTRPGAADACAQAGALAGSTACRCSPPGPGGPAPTTSAPGARTPCRSWRAAADGAERTG